MLSLHVRNTLYVHSLQLFQQQIPEKFSHTSFEDLQKLKERLGTKAYNETLFGKNEKRKKEFNKRRENKNGPLEMSAKIPVRSFKEVVKVKKVVSRDPRFDSLSGTFNEKAFKHSYAFVSDLRENDLKTLKKELKTTEDPKVIKKIKYLIQRLENQLREEKRLKEKQKKERQEKRELLDSMKRGEKPTFKKKCKFVHHIVNTVPLSSAYYISLLFVRLQRRRRSWT